MHFNSKTQNIHEALIERKTNVCTTKKEDNLVATLVGSHHRLKNGLVQYDTMLLLV